MRVALVALQGLLRDEDLLPRTVLAGRDILVGWLVVGCSPHVWGCRY